MRKEEIDELQRAVQKNLGEKWEVKPMTVKKIGGDKEAIGCKFQGDEFMVVLYPNEYENLLRSGTSIEKIGTHLAQEAEQKRYGFPQMPKTPEEFRRELYIQVINADMNEELLKNVVHDTMGDVAAAFRVLGKKEYIETATRAKREIIDRFYDKEYGGVFWSLDSQGRPLDTKKQIYALGFAIYGLSEYARATGDKEAEDYALRLFNDIEKYSFDNVKNGYFEALTRDWQPIADMRLSEKDANEHKTMNTHLHIIEPYTNLYRVCGDERLKERIANLLHIFREKILDRSTGHLQLFFDDDWNSKYSIISFVKC